MLFVGHDSWEGKSPWMDGDDRKLEDQLNDFVKALVRSAWEERCSRLAAEERHRRWREAEEKRREKEKKIEKVVYVPQGLVNLVVQ